MSETSPQRTVVITGTSRGIGYHLATRFLSEGYRVIGISRSATPIQDSNFRWIEADLSDATSIDRLRVALADEPIDGVNPEEGRVTFDRGHLVADIRIVIFERQCSSSGQHKVKPSVHRGMRETVRADPGVQPVEQIQDWLPRGSHGSPRGLRFKEQVGCERAVGVDENVDSRVNLAGNKRKRN